MVSTTYQRGDSRRRGTRTILVVDDSRTNLHVIGGRLGAMGYMVVLADSGREALDLISGRGFDLVLLDMVMPGMSGLDVLTEIRTAPDTADLPVIMITALSDSRGAVEALAAGADDHLAKPFDFGVLQARIERTLERAGRIVELKRTVASLDARIAARAIELGETRSELAVSRADRARLLGSIDALSAKVESLSGTSAA
ncbi:MULTISPECIES: two-component system response regulator [unclassified Sphingomonas]|uniref:response regulator n=1 Tax=unclassified Sphingomonas TaxID=196159 RepID=UPI0021ADFE32|nr:response regulator [Sphingomonas sp. J315]UUY01123.1 response regulator [Sphingomonas sp. J315]